MMSPRIDVFGSADALARAAAERMADIIQQGVRHRGRCVVALSGGSTPERLYRVLAEPSGPGSAVPWHAVHMCWGDERHVPPSHQDSNVRMAREALLKHVLIPAAQVHPIDGGDRDAEGAARRYEEDLRGLFGIGREDVPSLDLVLLGVGPDGHIASLFPGSPALRETQRLVMAPWVEQVGARRITLSPPVLLNAVDTMVLVTGRHKAAVLRRVLEGPMEPERFPAQLLRNARGHVRWLLDREAASALSQSDDLGRR